jgi:hypothetical protein
MEKKEWHSWWNKPRIESTVLDFDLEKIKMKNMGFKVKASKNKSRFFIMIKEP